LFISTLLAEARSVGNLGAAARNYDDTSDDETVDLYIGEKCKLDCIVDNKIKIIKYIVA
jgi:hypothetical protein